MTEPTNPYREDYEHTGRSAAWTEGFNAGKEAGWAERQRVIDELQRMRTEEGKACEAEVARLQSELAAAQAEVERLLGEEHSASRRANRLAQEVDRLREMRAHEHTQYEAQIKHLLDPLTMAAAKNPPPIVLDGDAAEVFRLRAEVERLNGVVSRAIKCKELLKEERNEWRSRAERLQRDLGVVWSSRQRRINLTKSTLRDEIGRRVAAEAEVERLRAELERQPVCIHDVPLSEACRACKADEFTAPPERKDESDPYPHLTRLSELARTPAVQESEDDCPSSEPFWRHESDDS